MGYEYILAECPDGVGVMTLNRPEKLNALSFSNEDEARATWLTSAHRRDGFKDFLSRKGRRA